MTDLIDIGELADMLSRRARDVVLALYPHAARQRSKARVVLGDVDGNDGQSLSIYLQGQKPGNWRDFSSGEAGDILDLVCQARCGGDKREAVRWARGFLGLETVDPATLSVRRKEDAIRAKEQKRLADADDINRKAAAARIYLEAYAGLKGTPVEAYLNARGLDLDKLPSLGALRFHPDCYCGKDQRKHPAMVAVMTGRDGKISAVHRTYLVPDGKGGWGNLRLPDEKGRIKNIKLVYGVGHEAYISLSKGDSAMPLGRAPYGDQCLIGEGIETCLTYAQACPRLRVVCAANLTYMAELPLPKAIITRFLVRENDTHPKAIEAFQRAVKFHQSQCDDVRIVETPSGFKDANDFVRGRAKA